MAGLIHHPIFKASFVFIPAWVLMMPKLFSFETITFFLAVLMMLLYRQKLGDLVQFKPVLLFASFILAFFVVVPLMPMFFHQPVGYEVISFMDKRALALYTLLYIVILFWQLKPDESVLWYGMLLGVLSVFFVVVHELYILGDFEKIFTQRFGDYSTPNVVRYGIYSNFYTLILLGAFLWSLRKGAVHTVVVIAAIILAFAGSLVSDTRTAWAGLPEAIVVWTIFYILYVNRKSQINMKRLLAYSFLFLSLLFATLYYFGDRVEKRWNAMTGDLSNYTSGKGNVGSIGARLVLFEAGIKGLFENPLTGVGEQNYLAEQKRLTNEIIRDIYGQDKSLAFTHMHNEYIHEAFTRGLPGLIGLILTLFGLLFLFLRKVKQNKTHDIWSPWPILGAVFIVSASVTLLAEAWLYWRTGISYFFFFISLFWLASQYLDKTSQKSVTTHHG